MKMSKKSLLTLSFILTLALTIACTEDVNSTNNSSPITEEQVVQKARQMIEGTVIKNEITTENGIKVYEVYMTALSGGELKIKYWIENGTMVEIKGISASFDY